MAEYLITNCDETSDNHDYREWDNGTLIYLKASKSDIDNFYRSGDFIGFADADLGRNWTAIATLGKDDDSRFIDFRLV